MKLPNLTRRDSRSLNPFWLTGILSRKEIVIMYANCPIFWRSSLQTEIAPSAAEAEHMASVSDQRQVLPLMTMKEEIDRVSPLLISKPNFVCKIHEDNQSCIKMATGTKFSPRTKHIALKYHHSRSHMISGRVDIHCRPTQEQLADLSTTPLSNEAFFVLRYMLHGWDYKWSTLCWVYWWHTFPTQQYFLSFYF